MAEHDALKLLRRQLDHHLEALDGCTDPALRAIMFRNLAKHTRKWTATLTKEAEHHEYAAFTQAKRAHPNLEAA